MNKTFRTTALLLLFYIMSAGLGFCSGVGGDMSKQDKEKPPSEAMKIVEKFKFKPLEFQVPKLGKEVERVVLPNGMILYMMEDHTVPQVSISGRIRTGEIYETKENHGVASLTGTVMRTGGTKERKPAQLDEELEYIAAHVETGIDTDYGSIYLYTISAQLDKGLELFADVLRNPDFDEKELALAKSQVKESIRRKNERSEGIGEREFYKAIYPDYPNGWEEDWKVIKNISRQDLLNWYNRFYKPNNMMFAIVGDFDKKEMIAKFNKLFGDWQKSDVDFSGKKTVKKEFHPGVFFVNKDVNQSYVRVGHLGVKRTNPDVFSILLMDYIMGGGGFSSYMTEKIRSDEGLAYMVYSYFNTSSGDYGTSGVVCMTKSKSTIHTIDLMKQIMNKMQTQKVPENKIKWAKDSIINSFVFNFSKPSQQVSNLMMLEYNDMPRDYYDNYLNNIRKVTADDIMKAAKTYLNPDKLTIVIVGNPKDFDKPLTSLGVETKEIKLEEFKEE